MVSKDVTCHHKKERAQKCNTNTWAMLLMMIVKLKLTTSVSVWVVDVADDEKMILLVFLRRRRKISAS